METTEQITNLGYNLILGESQSGKPTARATRPSKSKYGDKMLFNYSFASKERMEQFLNEFLQRELNRIERKESEKKIKQEATANLKASEHYQIGDVIVNSWGYEQTNIEFYKVIEVLPKAIKVAQINSKTVPGSDYSHGMACNAVPDVEGATGEPFILRLKADTNGKIWICNPKNFYYFHKWDGKPQYKSWYN